MAGRSLSLTAYRALSRRKGSLTYTPHSERQAGDYIWLHAGHGSRLPALKSLAFRLIDHFPDLNVVLSGDDVKDGAPLPDVALEPSPSDHPEAAHAFLKHWHPVAGLWDWGALKPNLLDQAGQMGIPMQLTSANSAGFDGRRDRWVPELARHLLRQFHVAYAQDTTTRTRLVRLGIPDDRLEIAPPLAIEGQLPTYVPSDLEDLSQKVAGRPVWLGAHLSRDEISAVISAHRIALRRSHRLLLILNPRSEKDLGMITDHLDQAALKFATWSAGEYPEDSHQVLIADLPDEHGLWYRLAPVTFLGQSLNPKSRGIDPFEASAVGTAVLYGPHVQDHVSSYGALVAASAGRMVTDPSSLGEALGRVIAPDVAAGMALAGWDVCSQGAEAANTAIKTFTSMLGRQIEDGS